jgi:FkbM family methyltransferase
VRVPVVFQEVVKSVLAHTAPSGLLRYVKKRYYRRMLERQNDGDQPEFFALRELVRAGESVVDIGANIGLFTCFLSRLVADRGVVHSIEPVPVTYDILANSVQAMGLKNVRLWNVAVSDHEGTAWMEVPTYPGRSRRNFYRAAIVAQERPTQSLSYRVNLTSLDALAGVVDSAPSFIKIDVEGHELAVIAGAMKLIAASRPSMLIEVSGDLDDPSSAAADLSRHLSRHGYAPYWLDGGQLKRRQAGVNSVNYFYLTAAHLQKFQRLLKHP